MWEKNFSEMINAHFAEKRKRNPRISTRAYAKQLGVSPATLTQVLKASPKWKISKKRALAIAEKLDFGATDKNRLYSLMGLPTSFRKVKMDDASYLIFEDDDAFALLFYFDLRLSLEEIAARVGWETERIEAMAEKLVAARLLEKSGERSYVRRKDFVLTTDGVPNEVMRRYQAARLRLAEAAINRVPTAERDITTLTFAGSSRRLSLVAAEIRKLHETAVALMDTENENDDVYQLSVALFPLSRSER